MESHERDASRMLTPDEVAERWAAHVKTVYTAIASGQLPVFRLGRVLRVPLAAVEAIEARGFIVPEGQPADT